jgi:hypothetical protein
MPSLVALSGAARPMRFLARRMGTPRGVRRSRGTLSLAKEPLRLMLVIVEKSLSSAASAARITREILEEPARPADISGQPYSPPRAQRADGGPPTEEVSVEPEVDVDAPQPGERGPEPDVVEPVDPEAVVPDAPAPPGPAVAEPPAPRQPTPMAEPDHLDERPVVAAEVAEAGAEEGAGAQVHVDQPWEGYGGMTAVQIRDRLANADPEVAAVVKLYEAANKGRRSVIEMADRRMRS